MYFKILFLICFCSLPISAQQILKREFDVSAKSPRISIQNRFGKVLVKALENQSTEEQTEQETKIRFEASSSSSPNEIVLEQHLIVNNAKESFEIAVKSVQKRIDLTLFVPARARLEIVGSDAEIVIEGNFAAAEISTDTGTIYADVPTDTLKYNFLWTESRPRFLSDITLAEIKEKAGGKFVINGKINETEKSLDSKILTPNPSEDIERDKDQKPKTKDKLISLNFTTKRGIILLNVPPSEVPPDLRERPLTEAAKAIVRSNDSILSEAIRQVSPKYFGDYARTLGNRRTIPRLNNAALTSSQIPNFGKNNEVLRRVNVFVTNADGHALGNLQANDFSVFENNAAREIVSAEPSVAPFNLVLLLDVSGSVEERLDFIRKAARNFLQTVGREDRLAIVTFRDDAQVLKNFTADKQELSVSLDQFEAGGGTALFDSLAFVLVDVLRPLRGERTAVVILSDGDDNRSFISFEPLIGAVQESGAIVYPLYIPSGLTLQNSAVNSNRSLDPLRNRYLTVTTKAEAQAKELARSSGGQYFPIQSVEDLQRAFENVVKQLRSAYSLTYRSQINQPTRLKVQVNREKVFVQTSPSIEVAESESQKK